MVGRRVLVTRAAADAVSLIDALAEARHEPVPLPLLRFGPGPDASRLSSAMTERASGGWLVLTSRHAVPALVDVRSSLARWRVMAVGAATADAVREAGLPVAFQGSGAGAEDLVRRFLAEAPPDVAFEVLYLAGSRSLDHLESGLTEAGHRVERIVTYVNETVRHDPAVIASALCDTDVGIFQSPSALDVLDVDLLGRLSLIVPGLTTARHAESLGLKNVVVAEGPTVSDLVAAIPSDSSRSMHR